jgi:membrane-associated protease RseP (regulator of RpoE activity)
MSSSQPSPGSSKPRGVGHAPFVASIAFMFAAGVMPAGAQQGEVAARRTPRAASGDSTERQLRALQHQLDSLTHVYNESDDISLVTRQRVGREIARTVAQLGDFLSHMGDDSSDHVMRPGDVRIRMAPMMAERAAAAASNMSRALMQAQETAMPRGWIGIVPEGANITRIEGGELIVRYYSYPRIVSVDPSSPAQRAGLTPGDSLFAYDGHDVRETDISMTRLLRPNAKVTVRIRRDGKILEIPVTVATAPSRIVQRRTEEVRDVETPWAIAGVPDAPAFPRAPLPPLASGSVMRAMTRAPVASATASAAPMPAAAAQQVFVFGLPSNGVAGAQLTTITEGLGRTIGVASGVLVTSASIGSPAFESGLTDGDVITKVAGQAVRSVSEVRDLVGLATDNGEHAVELEILRQKKPQKVVLRW